MSIVFGWGYSKVIIYYIFMNKDIEKFGFVI